MYENVKFDNFKCEYDVARAQFKVDYKMVAPRYISGNGKKK